MYTYLQEKKNLVFGKEKVYLALCEKKLFSLNLYAFSDGDPGGSDASLLIWAPKLSA